jgi:hypothetical protein
MRTEQSDDTQAVTDHSACAQKQSDDTQAVTDVKQNIKAEQQAPTSLQLIHMMMAN